MQVINFINKYIIKKQFFIVCFLVLLAEPFIYAQQSALNNGCFILQGNENIHEVSKANLQSEIAPEIKDYQPHTVLSILDINYKNLNTKYHPEVDTKKHIEHEFDVETTPEEKIIKLKNLDSESCIEMKYIQLESGGSSILLKSVDGDLMLFDCGKTSSDAEKIVSIIRNEIISEEQVISVLFTHPHQDHIGGLNYILEQNLPVVDVLVPKKDDIEGANKNLSYIETNLLKNGFSKEEVDWIAVFRKDEREKNGFDVINKRQAGISCLSLGINGEAIDFYLNYYANDVNNYSFIYRVENNSLSHLITGDIGINTIREVLNEIQKNKENLTPVVNELSNLRQEIDNEIKELEIRNFELIIIIRDNFSDEVFDENGKMIKYFPDLIQDFVDETKSHYNLDELSRLEKEKLYLNLLSDHKNRTTILENKIIKYEEVLKEFYKEQINIDCDILLWPHHYWLPELTETNKDILYHFLDEVSPEYILLSKPPNQTQNLENLLNFLNTYKLEKSPDLRIEIIDDGEGTRAIQGFMKIKIHDQYNNIVNSDNYLNSAA